ncbi:MAG: preprotein translocase subunit SecE [Bryobacterales bacterium]|jgi:preprotein translocase subunit SecE|nr:preprotein translocase subunit SecE [Bryobacterales bacterium]
MPENLQPAQGFAGKLQSFPNDFREYVRGLQMEMRKVTWPSRKQVRATTVVVVVTVFIFAIFFAVVDEVLSRAINSIQAAFTK